LQNVLVREPLVVNAVTAPQNRSLIAVDVPRKTKTRSKVVTVKASIQGAVLDAGGADKARQVHFFRIQEWVATLGG
jgi:hypothetical protein